MTLPLLNPMRISTTNLADTATITAFLGGTVATLPLSNAQLSNRRPARMTVPAGYPSVSPPAGIAVYQINIELPAAATVNCVAIWGHDFPNNYISAEFYTGPLPNQGYVGGNFTSVGSDFGNKFASLFLPDMTNVKHCKITFVAHGAIPQTLDFFRIWVGYADTVDYNPDYGFKLTQIDPSTQFRTDGGDLLVTQRKGWRELEFSLGLHDTNIDAGILRRADFFRIARLVGKRGDALVSLYPSQTLGYQLSVDHCILGKFEVLTNPQATRFNQYEMSCKIIEM